MINRRKTPRKKALWLRIKEQLNPPEPKVIKWMKPKSKNRAKVDQLYAFLKKKLGMELAGYDVHHTRGRAGTLLLDWRFWKCISRDVHNWIGNNPNLARQYYPQYVCERGEWNKSPNDDFAKELKSIMKISEKDMKGAKIMLKKLIDENPQ